MLAGCMQMNIGHVCLSLLVYEAMDLNEAAPEPKP